MSQRICQPKKSSLSDLSPLELPRAPCPKFRLTWLSYGGVTVPGALPHVGSDRRDLPVEGGISGFLHQTSPGSHAPGRTHTGNGTAHVAVVLDHQPRDDGQTGI